MRRVGYEVETRRAVFLLNRLLSANLSADRIERSEERIRFSVERSNALRLEELLEGCGFSFRRLGFLDFRESAKRVFRRPFLVFSVLLTLVGVFFFQSFTYGYSIRGNQYVNGETISAVLRAHGADGFAYKGSLDTEKIKREIAAVEGISFASVKIVGNRLQVSVKEELPREIPSDPTYAPVLSFHDAVVTKVVAESGTPCVKAGDRVQKGATLIDPIYRFAEGESAAPAKGEVWGAVTYKKEVFLPVFQSEKVRVGEVFRTREATLFGKRIGESVLPPFSDYEEESRVLLRGIGVEVTERIFYRLEERTVFHDLEQEGAALMKKALSDLLLSVSFCATERSGVAVTQKKVDNIIISVLYYTVEQRIDLL